MGADAFRFPSFEAADTDAIRPRPGDFRVCDPGSIKTTSEAADASTSAPCAADLTPVARALAPSLTGASNAAPGEAEADDAEAAAAAEEAAAGADAAAAGYAASGVLPITTPTSKEPTFVSVLK